MATRFCGKFLSSLRGEAKHRRGNLRMLDKIASSLCSSQWRVR